MNTICLLLAFLCCLRLSACSKGSIVESIKESEEPTISSKMKITIGTKVFTATLFDNASATAFKAMVPLTISMSELNGNEKFYYFSGTLPTNASVGGSIKAGDLMLYGNNCLVLFYENLNTSYSYTKLGKIDDVSGLETALGNGNISVKYEID